MPVAVVTRAVLAQARFTPGFAWGSLLCAVQARRSPGFLAGAMGIAPLEHAFWTLTLWRDGEAMRSFRQSGRHGAWMPRLSGWSSEAAFGAFKVEEARLPSWAEAHAQLLRRTVFAPVDRPSAAQAARVAPDPPRRMLAVPLPLRRGSTPAPTSR